MKRETTSVIIVGVGGQGTLLSAGILSEAAALSGLEVKSSEVHGMAQRGGSVLSQVRFGERVYSPLSPAGTGDYLVALEELEALRYRQLIRPKATIFLQRKRILPAPVLAGAAVYPPGIEETLTGEGYRVEGVDEADLVSRFNTAKPANIYLLGRLSRHLDFELTVWKRVIYRYIKESLRDLNWAAFRLGREDGNIRK
ncbi:MAG: indolepyruvate oxidoreductase subunit beta [Candidatus Erginobacter occultus]|nr:indolepyruvate oxidoreductase subunit beta [Candidatus Erginobacter occultus]